MEELKKISIEETELFLIDRKNSIYKAILDNNIENVYDLLVHIFKDNNYSSNKQTKMLYLVI